MVNMSRSRFKCVLGCENVLQTACLYFSIMSSDFRREKAAAFDNTEWYCFKNVAHKGSCKLDYVRLKNCTKEQNWGNAEFL